MRALLVVLALLPLAGCDSAREEAKSLNEARKDLVEEVGGAPKAQVDQAAAILKEAERDMATKDGAAIDKATAE